MGIAGAGNSGSLLATLFAPRLAQAIGWRNVFGVVIIPVVIVWIAFFVLARNAPIERKVKPWASYVSMRSPHGRMWVEDLSRPRG